MSKQSRNILSHLFVAAVASGLGPASLKFAQDVFKDAPESFWPVAIAIGLTVGGTIAASFGIDIKFYGKGKP